MYNATDTKQGHGNGQTFTFQAFQRAIRQETCTVFCTIGLFWQSLLPARRAEAGTADYC